MFLKRGNEFNKTEKPEFKYVGCPPCMELVSLKAACLDLKALGIQEPHSRIRLGRPFLGRARPPRLMLTAAGRDKAGHSLWHRCCHAIETTAHHSTQDHPKQWMSYGHRLFKQTISHFLFGLQDTWSPICI